MNRDIFSYLKVKVAVNHPAIISWGSLYHVILKYISKVCRFICFQVVSETGSMLQYKMSFWESSCGKVALKSIIMANLLNPNY